MPALLLRRLRQGLPGRDNGLRHARQFHHAVRGKGVSQAPSPSGTTKCLQKFHESNRVCSLYSLLDPSCTFSKNKNPQEMRLGFRNYMPPKEERRLSENALKMSEQHIRPALSLQPTSTGKVGLALSGGGFRASFFHLGVLANLADHGILRHVEVISAVSGGSIIATLYYLHLKRLLESVPDSRITDEDYRSIVSRMEQQFLAAVERN